MKGFKGSSAGHFNRETNYPRLLEGMFLQIPSCKTGCCPLGQFRQEFLPDLLGVREGVQVVLPMIAAMLSRRWSAATAQVTVS